MTTRIQKHGLQVAASLHQMIETEALPGTGVTPDQFWKGLSELVHTLGPKNRALLAKRDELQAKIDEFHAAAPGEVDFPKYKQFLTDIGYLVPVPEDREITTANVDTEITSTAGPPPSDRSSVPSTCTDAPGCSRSTSSS